MMSLDVSSLFTNVPVELMVKGIGDRWPHIKKVTKIPEDEFKNCIVFLMNNMFFQFDNKFYRQKIGTPMGSSISPILADIVMQDLKENVIKNFNFEIVSYKRYVDDTFLCVPRNKILVVVAAFNFFHNKL